VRFATTLNENQTVQYDLVENRGSTSAENLKVAQTGSRSAQPTTTHSPARAGDFCFFGLAPGIFVSLGSRRGFLFLWARAGDFVSLGSRRGFCFRWCYVLQ
jgi:hypothetical protein